LIVECGVPASSNPSSGGKASAIVCLPGEKIRGLYDKVGRIPDERQPAALNEMADSRSAAADFCNKIGTKRT